MRAPLLSLCFGVAVGLFLSGVLEAQPASAKKAKETRKKVEKVSCWETADTQFELNQCAGEGTRDAEQEMEKVLAKIAVAYKSHPTFFKHMERSQKAWKEWMYLEVAAHYPAEPGGGYSWGSVQPMCQRGLETSFIGERTRELASWLAPSDSEEGDVCGGIYQRHDQP